jgi:hypothetical protein
MVSFEAENPCKKKSAEAAVDNDAIETPIEKG